VEFSTWRVSRACNYKVLLLYEPAWFIYSIYSACLVVFRLSAVVAVTMYEYTKMAACGHGVWSRRTKLALCFFRRIRGNCLGGQGSGKTVENYLPYHTRARARTHALTHSLTHTIPGHII